MKTSSMYEYIKNDRFTKILSIVSFTFIILALIIIAVTPSAGGYEISIYDMYPWYFWFFVITSIFIGQLILVTNAIFNTEDRYWVFGLVAILTANAILLFMPLIRGYVIYGRDDVVTHIGLMKDLFKNGYLSSSNMYPIDHILGVIIFLFSDIKITDVTRIVPPIFSFFYVIFFYFLARQILDKRSEVLITMIFVSILLFGNAHLAFAPHPQSFFLFPFILYLYFKSRYSNLQLEFNTLHIILLFLLVFFHPLSTLMLVIILLVLDACIYIKSRISMIHDSNFKIRNGYNVVAIALVTFFTWHVSYTYLFANSLKDMYGWLIGEAKKSDFQSYSDLIALAKPTFIDLVKLILNVYGQFIVLGIFSLFCIFYLFIIVKKQKQKLKFYHLFSAVGFLFFSTFTIVALFLPIIVSFGRIFIIAILFSLILIPSSSYLLLKITKNKTRLSQFIKLAVLCIILVSILYYSTFNLYMSPKIKEGNQQVAVNELKGMETFFNIRDDEIPILEQGLSQVRFYDAIYGKDALRKNVIYGESARPIDHFGYTNNTSFSSSYKGPRYFLLNDLGRNFYPYIYSEYKEKWRYTQEDFNRLKIDPGVQIIYTNGNLDVYLTRRD